MPIPTTLKIGAHTFKVVFAKAWEEKNQDDLGMTVWEDQTIFILEGLSETMTFAVLWHEIKHVLNPEMDHQLLGCLSEGEAQVLIDNGFLR